jgi:hypothetical protein
MMTQGQKNCRRSAREYGAKTKEAIALAQLKMLPKQGDAEWWTAKATRFAKLAATFTFMAHPELREESEQQ